MGRTRSLLTTLAHPTGRNWAMPVRKRRWALVTTALETVKIASGYRLCVASAHRAWERAIAPVAA